MELKVLGPLEVTGKDGPVRIAGVKPRAILTTLGLYRGEVVSSDMLQEVLWGEEPPSGAHRALQTHVSALRRVLGTDAVTSWHGGWRVVAEEIDAASFYTAAGIGRQAARDADPVRAIAALSDALGWWRASPELPDTVRGIALVTSWHEEERSVADDWADAALACGRASEIIGALEAAVADMPLREHRWAQLMLALYRAGRQGEALRTFQRARRLLSEELGVEPGRELRELEARLLAQDPSLDALPREEPVLSPGRRISHSVPLPPRLELLPTGGFVGRSQELGNLKQVAREVAAQRQCRLVLIGGEPGIGKTALTAEFARAAHDDGAIVLYGACDEDLAVPYKPWAAALAHLLIHAGDRLEASVAAHGGSLVQLAPSLADVVGEHPHPSTTDGEVARYLMFNAVSSTLRATSGIVPVVVCLDDLQWADAGTMQLLRHVSAANESTPLLLLGTFRDTESASAHPLSELLAALRRDPGAERITLSGLDPAELLALMEKAAGYTLGSEAAWLRDSLLAETDGNPFFVWELLRHLADTGAVYTRDGRWTSSRDLRLHGSPVGAREVVGHRVARLGAEASRLLGIASVIGTEFDLALLSAVSEADEDALIDVMDRAVDAALVQNFHNNRYVFVHALIGHSLYDAMTPARRARLHRKIGEILEDRSGTATEALAVELAHHFALAAGPALEKAIRYAAVAGEAALAQLAPDEALRYYTQALSLLAGGSVPDEQLRCRLLVGLGEAQRQAGDSAFRQTLLEAANLARQLGTTELLVAAVLANDRGWMSALGTIDTERVAVLEAACVALEGVESSDRARILALLATELLFAGDFGRQRSLADEAMAIARACGPAEVAFVANRMSAAIASPETITERMSLTSEAVDAAEMSGDPVLRFWSALYRSTVLCEAGELGQANEQLQVSRNLAERLGQPLMMWAQTIRESLSAQVAGNLETAERLAIEAINVGSMVGQTDAPIVFTTQLGPIRFMQGRAAEIIEPAAHGAAQNRGLPGFSTFLAQLYADLDRPEDVRAALEPFVASRFTSFMEQRRSGFLISLAYAAYAVSSIRWTEAAEMLYDALVPCADLIPVAIATSSACQMSYYLGRLAASTGRDQEAERHFSQAASANERIGASWGLAMTHLGWAEFLIDRGRPEDAERATLMLNAALDASVARGYQQVERRARRAMTP